MELACIFSQLVAKVGAIKVAPRFLTVLIPALADKGRFF